MRSIPTIDTYTRWADPVRDAAATRLRVASASPLVLVAQWMMAVAAVTAGSMPRPVRRSAVKNVTPRGVGRSCRASTRTSQPLSCSRATTSFPRRPVPPVTRTGEAMGSPYADQPSRGNRDDEHQAGLLSHRRGLDGHLYVRPRQENVTDERP